MTDSHSSTQYRDRLQPWCIIRHLPKLQRVTIDRFRARQDAEAYLQVLQSLTPTFSYSLVFDRVSDALVEQDQARRSVL
jgi:hypothetical protein